MSFPPQTFTLVKVGNRQGVAGSGSGMKGGAEDSHLSDMAGFVIVITQLGRLSVVDANGVCNGCGNTWLVFCI